MCVCTCFKWKLQFFKYIHVSGILLAMHERMCVYIYIYLCIYIYVYICIYIYTHSNFVRDMTIAWTNQTGDMTGCWFQLSSWNEVLNSLKVR